MEEDLSRREENKMEQTYVIENCKSVNARDIFECGQCFRWNVQEDGSYTGTGEYDHDGNYVGPNPNAGNDEYS